MEGLSPKVEPHRVAARANRGVWAQEAGWVGALEVRVLTGVERERPEERERALSPTVLS